MIRFRHRGDLSKATSYLERLKRFAKLSDLDNYGRIGVAALASATPVDTGLTASSWYYQINQTANSVTLSFHNSNVQNGVPIAVVIQYGHGTQSGGWVQGRDYVNPSIQPIFDQIADQMWKEVTKT